MTEFSQKILTSVPWASDALELCAFLESHGIEARVSEEHLSSIFPQMTAHQIHVVVPADKLAEAQELLKSREGSEEPSVADACPSGGTHDFQAKPQGGTNFFRFLLGLIAGTSMRRAEGQPICRKCGMKTPTTYPRL